MDLSGKHLLFTIYFVIYYPKKVSLKKNARDLKTAHYMTHYIKRVSCRCSCCTSMTLNKFFFSFAEA